jgi:hypothetical protein
MHRDTPQRVIFVLSGGVFAAPLPVSAEGNLFRESEQKKEADISASKSPKRIKPERKKIAGPLCHHPLTGLEK